MKKRICFIMAVMTAGMLVFAGCGDKKDNADGSVNDTEAAVLDAFDFDVNDYVTLGEYKNLAVRYPVPSLTDDDLEMEIEYLLEENTQYNEITDRGVQNGDYLNIDFTGTIDGEEFEGGSDTDYEFTMGEEEFLEEFENNLIGKNSGETVTFQMTFPEDYDDEIGGKEAEFSVTINSIEEVVVPEYNDEFIAQITDYDTTAAYEEALQEELMEYALEDAKYTAGSDALQMAIDNATINGYPQALYDACYDSTLQEYQEYAEMFGMELSDFLGDDDEIDAEVLDWVNEILVSQAIAEKEGFEITEDDYQEEAQNLALEYDYESLEDFTADYGEVYVKATLLSERAIDFLYENADIEEVSQEEYNGGDDSLEDLEELSDTEILFEEDTE